MIAIDFPSIRLALAESRCQRAQSHSGLASHSLDHGVGASAGEQVDRMTPRGPEGAAINMYGVAIVMDPAFGRLPELAARLHVWVIDTPENRALAVTLYGVDDQGVTLFKAATAEDPNAVVASMLSTIDDHHGEHSHDPPWSFIEVHGATPTGDLEVALAEYGLNKIERLNATSFIASRAS